MDYKVLYILTVRCSDKICEEDLACYKIEKSDENAIYIMDKAVSRDELMEVEILNNWYGDIVVRVPFLIKEAAIVWVRECFMYILKKGTTEMKANVRQEWFNILNPEYDCFWFTGGQKVEKWRKEMTLLAQNYNKIDSPCS